MFSNFGHYSSQFAFSLLFLWHLPLQHLVSTAKVDIRQFSDANADANKFKNRFMNFLPCKLVN